MSRHRDWLRQAENDMQWAQCSMAGGFFAQTCFVAQQAAEKALKACCQARGFDVIRSHSLFLIVKELGINGKLEQYARELDIYYIAGRYPDAFPAGAPFELITEEQARRAIDAAAGIIHIVKKLMEEE